MTDCSVNWSSPFPKPAPARSFYILAASHFHWEQPSFLTTKCTEFINPRSIEEKIVTRSLEGGGGQLGPPSSSTFDTSHPIDMNCVRKRENTITHTFFLKNPKFIRTCG